MTRTKPRQYSITVTATTILIYQRNKKRYTLHANEISSLFIQCQHVSANVNDSLHNIRYYYYDVLF